MMWASLAWDQGSEMAQHAKVSLATKVPIYFADPHSPWQRPSNENTNRLYREYLPKGTVIPDHQPYLTTIAEEINNRPLLQRVQACRERTRSLPRLGLWGTRCEDHAVAPAFTTTEMTAGIWSDDTDLAPFIDRIALGRPDDVVGPVLFLASEDASYITGSVLTVDGEPAPPPGSPAGESLRGCPVRLPLRCAPSHAPGGGALSPWPGRAGPRPGCTRSR